MYLTEVNYMIWHLKRINIWIGMIYVEIYESQLPPHHEKIRILKNSTALFIYAKTNCYNPCLNANSYIITYILIKRWLTLKIDTLNLNGFNYSFDKIKFLVFGL